MLQTPITPDPTLESLVRQMRTAQRNYFANRGNSALLDAAKRLEREVDELLARRQQVRDERQIELPWTE